MTDSLGGRGLNSRQGRILGGFNVAPVADWEYSPTQDIIAEYTTVTLDGSLSSDEDGDPLSYDWDTDADGAIDTTGEIVDHSFAAAGTRDVALTVDDGELTDSKSLSVTVYSNIIDNFEDGDISVKSGLWNGWNGATGKLSAQQTVVLAGDWSGAFDIETSTSATIDASGPEVSPDEIRYLWQCSETWGASDAGAFEFTQSGTRVIQLSMASGADLELYGGGGKVGDYQANTPYLTRFYNIDWPNDSFDFEVTDLGTDSVVASGNAGFANSASGFDGLTIVNNADNSTPNPILYFDDVLFR